MLVLEAAARQLKELERQLLASNPKLENHLALYLQVLRDGLLAAVQQACFHLATQVYPDRYGGLEPSSRQLLRPIAALAPRRSLRPRPRPRLLRQRLNRRPGRAARLQKRALRRPLKHRLQPPVRSIRCSGGAR